MRREKGLNLKLKIDGNLSTNNHVTVKGFIRPVTGHDF